MIYSVFTLPDIYTYIYIHIFAPTGGSKEDLAASETAAGPLEDEPTELATPKPLQEPLAADPSNQQDYPPSTTSQKKRPPMLIVPKNWDVPIYQPMVDIFAVAKNGAPEPPECDREGQQPEEGPQPACLRPDCPPEPEGPRPEGPQQNGIVEKMEVDEEPEPPVTLRVDQWKLKPAGRGRGRGKGRGRGGRGKACAGEIMVESSADEAGEGDAESTAAVASVGADVEKKPRRRPKAKSQPKAKAKSKPKAKSSSSRKRSSTAEGSSEIHASGDNVNEESFFC